MTEQYVPKCVLVTGGAGFIASNFLNYMVAQYPTISFVNLDRLDYCSSLKNITVTDAANYSFVQGDVGSIDLLRFILLSHNVDTVIHFAAQSHVCNSFSSSLQYTKDNVLATHVLLEAVREYGKVGRFIQVSTDEVYGEVEQGNSTEQSLLLPTNPYAATKAAAELIVRSYHISHKLPVIITRGNNVWGPRQYPEKLIPKFIMALLNGERCTIHGVGATRRNFLHTDDVTRAFETILFKGVVGKIYNIGTECEYTVLQLTEMLRQRICPEKSLAEVTVSVADRLFNDMRYAVDSDALRALGWSEQVDFVTELDAVIQWYRVNGGEQWGGL